MKKHIKKKFSWLLVIEGILLAFFYGYICYDMMDHMLYGILGTFNFLGIWFIFLSYSQKKWNTKLLVALFIISSIALGTALVAYFYGWDSSTIPLTIVALCALSVISHPIIGGVILLTNYFLS